MGNQRSKGRWSLTLSVSALYDNAKILDRLKIKVHSICSGPLCACAVSG